MLDITAPILTLPGAPTFIVSAEAEGPDGAIVEYSATADDDFDGEIAVTCSQESGSLFPLGNTQVDCSATDVIGNTANGSFTVAVEDTTMPTFDDVPQGTIAAEATGLGGATVTYNVTASDLVDTDVTVECSLPSGSTFSIGTTNVMCTATDNEGNFATASFDVSVSDTIPPTVMVPSNVLAEATSPAGAVVTYAGATAEDIVSGTLTPTCLPATGSTFPLGTTTVTCTAVDASSNSGSSTLRYHGRRHNGTRSLGSPHLDL